MTYRGFYMDGVVFLQGDVDLKDGTTVDVQPAARRKSKAVGAKRTRAEARKVETVEGIKLPLPGFGAWKHRTDIKDSVEFARQLRRKVSTRGKRA